MQGNFNCHDMAPQGISIYPVSSVGPNIVDRVCTCRGLPFMPGFFMEISCRQHALAYGPWQAGAAQAVEAGLHNAPVRQQAIVKPPFLHRHSTFKLSPNLGPRRRMQQAKHDVKTVGDALSRHDVLVWLITASSGGPDIRHTDPLHVKCSPHNKTSQAP